MKRNVTGLVLMLSALAAVNVEAQSNDEDLTVIREWMLYSDAANSLYHHLRSEAFRLLEERSREIATVETASEWRARRDAVRKALVEAMGPFPPRTPLNARVTGTVEREGYRVEKLVYESRPSFFVTAALFLPTEAARPSPAILYCSGHSAEGFRAPAYQTTILNLVRKGFVVLAFDPAGQGERLQYLDESTGESGIGGPTLEHSYPGAQQLLIGRSPAHGMVWDGIRGIDYLTSRSEVDPSRLGVAGRSGGGTQTAYIAAVDERVRAAAPEAYITSFRRLLSSRGPQDAEQNLFHGIARGLDHADLIHARAPKPTLIVATTRDFFSIQGTRETFSELQRSYRALGAPQHLEMVEDDAAHESTRANREALYDFFQRALELPGSPAEEELEHLSAEELRVTETGQVATSLGGETLFTLNHAEATGHLEALERSRQRDTVHIAAVRREAARLSGLRAPADFHEPVFAGRYQRDGYRVEKYFVPGEGDYVVPYLLMLPEGAGPHPALVYLHPGGKAAEAAPGGEIEQLIGRGFAVAAPDLLGIGETGPGGFRGDAYIEDISYNVWFSAMLLGRSVVGVRAGDVLRLASLLRARPDIDAENVSAIAHGTMGPVLLHAAALDPSVPPKLSRVALVGSLASYGSLVESRNYRPDFVPASVAGALVAYDLPDLTASLAPRPLLLLNPVDGSGAAATGDALTEATAFIRSTYDARRARARLDIRTSHEERATLEAWLERTAKP